MGTGKSSIGRKLAAKLGCSFIDIDTIIEKTERKKISLIFKNQGEEYFRQKEFEAIRKISFQRPAVVSLGGGAILFYRNREILRRGCWINLNASVATIYKRVQHSKNRPVLGTKPTPEKISELLNARRPFYRLAPIQIDTDGLAPDLIVQKILNICPQ